MASTAHQHFQIDRHIARHRGIVLPTLVVIKIEPQNILEFLSNAGQKDKWSPLPIAPSSSCAPASRRALSVPVKLLSSTVHPDREKSGHSKVEGISCITLISSVSPSLSIHPAYKSCSPNLSYHRSRRRTEVNPPRCEKWGVKAPSSTYQCPWKHKDIASRALANKKALARNKTLKQSQRNEERRRERICKSSTANCT